MLQLYLLTAQWAQELVKNAEGVDPHTRKKAEFYVQQITNAIAPSNFILTNPEVLRETLASNGDNLVRGMKMLAEDIEAGRGDIVVVSAEVPHKFKNAGDAVYGDNLALMGGFAVVNVNFANRVVDLPYVSAEVAFDGSDTLLKPLAWQGDMSFGPPRNGREACAVPRGPISV